MSDDTSDSPNKRPHLGDGPSPSPAATPKKKAAAVDRRKLVNDLKAKLEQAYTREKELRRDLSQRDVDVRKLSEDIRSRDHEILQLNLRVAEGSYDGEDVEMSRLEELEELEEKYEVLQEALQISNRQIEAITFEKAELAKSTMVLQQDLLSATKKHADDLAQAAVKTDALLVAQRETFEAQIESNAREYHKILEQRNIQIVKLQSQLEQAFRSPRNPSPSPERHNARFRRPTRGRARGRKFDPSKLAAPLPSLPVRLEVPMDASTATGASSMADDAATAGASMPSSIASDAAPQSRPRAPQVGEPQPPKTLVRLGVDPSRGPEERLIFHSHYSWTRVISDERIAWAKYLDQLAAYYKCNRSDYANEYHAINRELWREIYGVPGYSDFSGYTPVSDAEAQALSNGTGAGPDEKCHLYFGDQFTSSIWNRRVIERLTRRFKELAAQEQSWLPPVSDGYLAGLLHSSLVQCQKHWNQWQPRRDDTKDRLETVDEALARASSEREQSLRQASLTTIRTTKLQRRQYWVNVILSMKEAEQPPPPDLGVWRQWATGLSKCRPDVMTDEEFTIETKSDGTKHNVYLIGQPPWRDTTLSLALRTIDREAKAADLKGVPTAIATERRYTNEISTQRAPEGLYRPFYDSAWLTERLKTSDMYVEEPDFDWHEVTITNL